MTQKASILPLFKTNLDMSHFESLKSTFLAFKKVVPIGGREGGRGVVWTKSKRTPVFFVTSSLCEAKFFSQYFVSVDQQSLDSVTHTRGAKAKICERAKMSI